MRLYNLSWGKHRYCGWNFQNLNSEGGKEKRKKGEEESERKITLIYASDCE